MARSSEKGGKAETTEAARKAKTTAKPTAGARGGITAPVTPSAEALHGAGKDVVAGARPGVHHEKS